MHPSLTHGAFSWSELMTSDPKAACDFYASILPWSSQTMPMPEGDYYLQMLGGKMPVAGMMAPPEPMPTFWSYYITVDSVDKALEIATEEGAKVMFGPVDIPATGRMAGFQDPQGAYVSVITFEKMDDMPDVNFADAFRTPGAFSWFSLQTSDVEAAKVFYTKLCGWTFRTDMMEMGPYTSILVDDDVAIGGIMPIMQEGTPPHWNSFITVEDADATAVAVSSNGGTVIVPPMDIPTVGRFSLIQDPTGGMINVIKYLPQPA